MTIALELTEAGDFDIALDPDTGFILNEGAELYTAVAISLFTRRYDPATRGPNGYWADAITGDPMGSRLHLLEHEKATTATLRLAQIYTEEALAWMLEDKVARRITVTTKYVRARTIGITTEIVNANDRLWRHVWEVLVAPV